MPNVFFTSDLHFGHKNLLGFRSEVHKKLFPTVEHMHDWMIECWNKVVRPKDLVWILGDIAMTDDGLKEIRNLNGRKKLILGNHDKFQISQLTPYFEAVHGVWKKYDFVMSHVPIHTSCLEYRWFNNVHGHIHHKHYPINTDANYLNVNMDVIGPYPMALEVVRAKLKTKEAE